MKEPDPDDFVDLPDDWNNYAQEPFVEAYGGLDDSAWEQKCLEALDEPRQDGIAFPRVPPAAMQERVHGHSGAPALREAFDFCRLVTAFAAKLNMPIGRGTRLLDFGAGWGRIVRPFMARVELRNLYCYEPNPLFAQVARALNPYVSTVSGDYEPPTVFGDERFDVIVAWSVFTHLPVQLARRWLEDFARILRPGGLVFITAWGERFIDQLLRDQQRMQSGQDVHWFHRHVIDSVGDLRALRARYRAGEVVFVPSGVDPNYGDAFMSAKGARTLPGHGLQLVAQDEYALAQDLLVYRRS